MKILKFLLFTFLIIFSFSGFARSQSENTFTSLTGGFSVNLPDEIRGGGSNGTAGGVNLIWQQPEGNYEIGFYEIEGLPYAEVDGKFSYDEMVSNYFNKFSASGEKIYDKDVLSEKNTGREYKYKTGSSLFILRLFQVGDRVYRLLAEIPLKNQNVEEKVLKVFDSFKILDREKLNEAMAKEIADATPKSLPQTPVAAKLKSDLHDRNLKGNIKSVLTETALFGVNSSLQKKKPQSLEEFNESGNLLKKIEYDSYGNPSIIKVFGYIAGKRVSRTGSISSENQPGGIGFDFPTSAKSDKRFDESYTYKYAGENLVEERVLFSNGILQSRSVIRYLKNKKEQSFYDGGTKPFQKIVYTLDEKGNEIEIIVMNSGGFNGDEAEKFKVEYESFDEKGNWTKRKISKLYSFGDTGSYQPEFMEYRTIVY